MTNNSNVTTKNIVNDNAVYNIINQVVKCDCNTTKHDTQDPDCLCEDCYEEQIDRLNEQLKRKAVLDDRERILHGIRWSNVQNLCGIIDDPSKCMRVIEFLEKLINEGEQK